MGYLTVQELIDFLEVTNPENVVTALDGRILIQDRLNARVVKSIEVE